MKNKVPVTITIDEKNLEEFKGICQSRGMKVSTKINLLIEEWIRKEKAGSSARQPR